MDEITVVFEPATEESIAAGLVEHSATEAAQAARTAARQAVLDKLGLTADEVAALLS